MATLKPGQLFDPATFSPEQAAMLTNIPGQSLSATNSAAAIAAAQALSPNISPTQISPATPLSLPASSTTPDYNAILAGTGGSLPKLAAETAVEKNQQDILAKMNELSGQTADYLAKQEEFGVNADRKQLTDLQAQLTAVNNEAAASTLQVDAQGRPTILTAAANIEKGNIERDRTIKALRLSSSIQAVQGNLQLAQDQVDRAISLKYDPLKQQLETLNKQLEFNYKTFDKAEQRRADALKALNDEKLKKLEVQQNADKAFETAKIQGLTNGMPVNISAQAEAAYRAGDTDKAYSIMSKYTGTAGNQVGSGTGTGTGTYVPGQNPEIDNWAKLIISGQSKITDVPNPKGSTLRTDVINAIANSGQLLLSDKDRDKLSAITNATSVVTAMKELLGGQSPSNVASRYFFRGPLNYWGAKFQTNDSLAAFNSAREGFVSNIARALGEKGALAEGDVARAVANIPNIRDTAAVAQRKWDTIFGILQKGKDAVINTSTQPVNQLNGGSAAPAGSSKNYLGI